MPRVRTQTCLTRSPLYYSRLTAVSWEIRFAATLSIISKILGERWILNEWNGSKWEIFVRRERHSKAKVFQNRLSFETPLSYPVTRISSTNYFLTYFAILLLLEEKRNSTSTDISPHTISSIVKSLSRFNPFRGLLLGWMYTTAADIRSRVNIPRRIKIQPEGCRFETSH